MTIYADDVQSAIKALRDAADDLYLRAELQPPQERWEKFTDNEKIDMLVRVERERFYVDVD